MQAVLRRFADHADKWLFFSLFVVGSGLILIFDLNHVSKVLAVIICTALLIGYAAATSLIPAVRLRADQAADNSYYLGLLYTLTSLGVALFRFSTADDAADAILRNFGIAIATTIVGLGLRVFLSQFREDPDDLEFEAKTALAESVRAMRGELDRSIAEMQSFGVGAKQALEELSESASKSTLGTLTTTVARFEGAADDMSRRLEATATSLELRTGSFESALQKFADVVETLSSNIGAVRVDAGMLEKGMQPAFDALQTRVTAFAATFDNEQQRLAGGLQALERLSTSLQAFDHSADIISASSQKLGDAASSIGTGADSLSRLGAASRSAADSAETYSHQLAKIADDQARQGQATFAALEGATAQLAARTTTSVASVEDATRGLSKAIAGMNSEFSQSSASVEQVRRELAQLAGWIITRLEAK